MSLDIHPGAAPDFDEVWSDRIWPSRVDRKQAIIDTAVSDLALYTKIDEDDRSWLVLCLDEAVVNAIVHGNEADPSTDISIGIGRIGQCWVVRIDDLGDGFTADAVPDQDDPSSLMLEHGRGIRLMREWLDQLAWYRNGATIFMARHLAPREPHGI